MRSPVPDWRFKMKLTIRERFAIVQVTPRESNIATQLIVRGILERLRFTPAEQAKLNIRFDLTQLLWDPTKEEAVEFPLSKEETDFLQLQVDRADREGRITQEILSLCLKIKGGEDDKGKSKTNKEGQEGKESPKA